MLMQCHQTLGTRNPYSYSNFSFHVDACHLCNVIKLWAQGTQILNQTSLFMLMQCHQSLGTRNPYSYSNFSFHVDACHLCNVIKLWAQGAHLLNQTSLFTLMHAIYAMPSNFGHKEPIFLLKLLFSR